MIKRKLSRQTIAIIILSILLLISMAIGGVFAFYSGDNVHGKIIMASPEYSSFEVVQTRDKNVYVYKITFRYNNINKDDKYISNLHIGLLYKDKEDLYKFETLYIESNTNKTFSFEHCTDKFYNKFELCLINEYGVRTTIEHYKLSFKYILYWVWGLIAISFIMFYIAYIKLKISGNKKYLIVLIPLMFVIFCLILMDHELNNSGILGYVLSLVALALPIIDCCVNI